MKLRIGQCSHCKTKFRRKTARELLSAIGKHMWSKHREWMVSRIKAGQKRVDKPNPTAQQIIGKLMQTVFPQVPPPSKHADRAIAIVDVAVTASRGKLDPKILLIWSSFKAMYRFKKFGKELAG